MCVCVCACVCMCACMHAMILHNLISLIIDLLCIFDHVGWSLMYSFFLISVLMYVMCMCNREHVCVCVCAHPFGVFSFIEDQATPQIPVRLNKVLCYATAWFAGVG